MRAIILLAILFFLLATPLSVFAQTPLSISGLTQSLTTIPIYEKLEISFSVTGSVAKNFQFPCDTNQSTPSTGTGALSTGQGITVDAVLTSPSGTIIRQPAFLYTPYTFVEASDFYHPTGTAPYWLVRFAPQNSGNWSYHIEARDGTTCQNFARYPAASELTFSATPAQSGNHGFIRVSPTDKRYFEFSDGTPFFGMGIASNADGAISQIRSKFSQYAQYGVNFVRMWMTQGIIWGMGVYNHGWDAWAGAINYRTNAQKYGLGDFSVLLNNGQAITQTDGGQFHNSSLETGTTYKLRLRAQLRNVTGTAGNGLVVQIPGNSAISFTGNSPAWQVWEAQFTNSARVNLDGLSVRVQNAGASAQVYLDEIYIGKVVNPSTPATLDDLSLGLGANVVFKPNVNYHLHFDEIAAQKYDRVIDVAKQNNVFMKLVVSDQRDGVLQCIDPVTGTWINNNNTDNCADNNFFSTRTGKMRRLQEYYWRYLTARWGYATSIHSWELTNEGSPGDSIHENNSDHMGEYFSTNDPNRHMASTSYYAGFEPNYFNAPSTRVSYGDFHAYSCTSWITFCEEDGRFSPSRCNQSVGIHAVDPAVISACQPYINNYSQAQSCYLNRINADTAMWHTEHSLVARSQVANMPLVRGETGLGTTGGGTCWDNDDPRLSRDPNGTWLHNFVWSQLNSGGLYELYWWNDYILSQPGPDGSTANGLFEIYLPYQQFTANIPLSNGKYQDITPVVSNQASVVAWGQKDTTNNRAHLWIENRKHIWCAIAGGVTGCPYTWDSSALTGTVDITGFSPSTSYPVEYWQFNHPGNLTKTTATLTADSSGKISIALSSLPSTTTDVAVKIGNYTPSAASPTPPAPPNYKNLLLAWLTSNLDQNQDGKVNSLDFAKLLP